MKKLTASEIKSHIAAAQKVVYAIQDLKTPALENGKIDASQFNEITAVQGRLQNKINELNVMLIERRIEEVSIDESGPAARLLTSVNRLNEAINELENIKKFIDAAAAVINGLSVIIGKIAGLISV